MLALAIYEAGVCDCGFHASLTNDRENFFTFEEQVCPVCRGVDRYARIQDEQDKAARDRIPEGARANTPDPADGRKTFTRSMNAAEVAATKARFQPARKEEPDGSAQ